MELNSPKSSSIDPYHVSPYPKHATMMLMAEIMKNDIVSKQTERVYRKQHPAMVIHVFYGAETVEKYRSSRGHARQDVG